MNGVFQEGDRVEACKLLSWTVEEFEDYPLIVQEGGQGTIVEMTGDRVYIHWDKDRFKHMPKCIILSHWEVPPIRVAG